MEKVHFATSNTSYVLQNFTFVEFSEFSEFKENIRIGKTHVLCLKVTVFLISHKAYWRSGFG